MDFGFHGIAWDLCMVRFDEGLAAALEGAGHRRVMLSGKGAHLVLAHVDPLDAKPYLRPDAGVFVVALMRQPRPPANMEAFALEWIVRSLAHLVILVVGPEAAPETYVRTLDRSLERIQAPAFSPRLFAQLLDRMRLLDVHLVMDNIFDRDLEPELLDGGTALPAMRRAASRFAEAGALRAGPSISDILSHQEQRHLERLFQGSRVSYGNLSLRQDAQRFWMSTSGVDWHHVEMVGRDVQLVKGYDAASKAVLVSVPSGVRPRRVSLDALTHLLIYRANPAIGAIVHLHAWLEGLGTVAPDYARGSIERAQSIASLVGASPDPLHAVVGIERHGIVMAGEDLDEILRRVEASVLLPVPEGTSR